MWKELGSFNQMFGRCMNYLSLNTVCLNGKLKMFTAFLSATFYLPCKSPQIPMVNNKWVLLSQKGSKQLPSIYCLGSEVRLRLNTLVK